MKNYEIEYIKDNLDVPEEELERSNSYQVTEEAESQIQQIIKEFFQRLQGAESADEFDKFWEERLKKYTKSGLFSEFLDEVTDRLQLDIGYPYGEEEIQEALFEITEMKLGEQDVVNVVYDLIEDKYPNLITKETEGMSKEEYIDRYREHLEEEISKIEEGVVDKEKYKEFFEQVENTEIEEIAKQLNRRIDYGIEIWKILLYSMLSARAKPIQINGLEKRSSIHTLLLGDISTAKSQALDILRELSPNAVKVDDVTKASFVGNFDPSSKEIQEGIIDKASDGNLIFEELDKTSIDSEIWRVVMDNRRLSISKGGSEKTFDINMSVMCGANPKNDFFRDDKKLIKEVPFRYGELSRFVVIPLVVSTRKNEKILDKMKLFRDVDDDFDKKELQDKINLLSKKIESVESLDLEDDFQQRIKEFFLNYNDLTENGIPLVIPRDLETIARLLNVITILNNEVEGNKVKAREEDVNEALSLWETLINMRKKLYEKEKKKELENVVDREIYNEILKIRQDGKVTRKELKERVVPNTCSKSTFYRRIDNLVQEGLIAKKGDRNSELIPVSDD